MSQHQPIAVNAQRKPRSRADKVLNGLIGLNILMVIIVIAFIAVMPGSGEKSSKAQTQAELAALSGQNTSAKLKSSELTGMVKGSDSAARAEQAGPALALGGGQATPIPSDVYDPPVADQGGTCISGRIIDVYHNMIGDGWEVIVRPNKDGAKDEKLPVKNGNFGPLSNLSAGTYTVELPAYEGYRPFTPASFQVTLSGNGDKCAEVRFKMEPLACLTVYKYDNMPVRVGLPGWDVYAELGDVKLQGLTDGEGKYTFANLLPGTWTISEGSRPGWIPSAGQTTSHKVTLLPPLTPGQCQVETFLNEQIHTSCIAAKKVDNQGNPIPDWEFTLISKSGTYASIPGKTAANGIAMFPTVPLGDWIVKETVQPGWQATGPTEQTVTLKEYDGLCPLVTFENEPLGCIDGTKINHLETGLPGWEIKAQNVDTGKTFTQITGIDGYFKFDALPLGKYTVSETPQQGWDPVTAQSFTVDVDTQIECNHVRFKNKTQYACLDVYKRDSFDNSGIPGWEVHLKPKYGGNDITGITDGSGWTRFNGLAPGEYILSEVMQNGWAPNGPMSTEITLENSGICPVYTFYNYQTERVRPDNPASPDQAGPDNPCREYYTVKHGDTLYGISRAYGVQLTDIRKVNNIPNPNLIFPGMMVCIPK